TPATYIIRFKLHKTTVILHVDPLQTIASVKAELLNALRQTSKDGIVEGFQIPEDDAEVALARPVDLNDMEKGWRRLRDEEAASGTATRSSKGKGKQKAGSKREPKGVDAECLKSLGIKDNAVLAFRFGDAAEEDTNTKKRKADELDAKDTLEVDEEESDQSKAEEWDVILPSWDDMYGVENVGDVGVIQEYEG
ncbi:hypothetical protein NA57DRAFT_20002, partial [Rhizodiscina lignyota]